MRDERPFFSFKLSNKRPKKSKGPPKPEDILKALKSYDFTHITPQSITDLTNLITLYQNKHHPYIPLGSFGNIEYSFSPEALAPSSLNPENASAPGDPFIRDLFKNLQFINTKDEGPGATRPALALGKLKQPISILIESLSRIGLFSCIRLD
jgi:hypothetical protein